MVKSSERGVMAASDLRVPNVPLANVENDEEEQSIITTVITSADSNNPHSTDDNELLSNGCALDDENNKTDERRSRSSGPPTGKTRLQSPSSRSNSSVEQGDGSGSTFGEGLAGGMAGSLEDLVSNFDEKITECFKDYQQNTAGIAPVQVRTQDEAMTESQIWWTLTGNFGNILPIDWSKTQARQMQLPALNLRPKRQSTDSGGGGGTCRLSESSDDELTAAMDAHGALMVGRSPSSIGAQNSVDTPTQTADQVIKEIDDIMQESSAGESDFTTSTMTDRTMESAADSMYGSMHRSPMPAFSLQRDLELEEKIKQAKSLTGSTDKLKSLHYSKLVALHSEMESLIQAYNEALVQELALKDELEYEKELKNAFISLLLSIQNKRRHYAAQVKKRASVGATVPPPPNGVLPQYLTAVIPYQEPISCSPDNTTLQALIKILKAVNEDNQNVPNMLTDYILNVVCASQSEALRLH